VGGISHSSREGKTPVGRLIPGENLSLSRTEVPTSERTAVSAESVQALAEGMISDYITGKPVKETEKEKIRQEAARSMIFEYQIAPESMEADFSVKVEGKKKRADIAIFEVAKEHTLENLRRVVVCRPEPNLGRRSVTKIRDFDQAEKDLGDLKEIMLGSPGCEWGLWTNGLERFFFRKDKRRFETRFEPNGDWPMADGTMSTPEAHSQSYVRKADDLALKRAFQRCYNFIHGNEGMPKDAAFWQFLYLIFAKMYDERVNQGADRKFFAYAKEPFTPEGAMAIRNRILPLFETMKKRYPTLFKPTDAITLSARAGLHGDGTGSLRLYAFGD
jgi:type I restriction enzyme M protein